MTNADVTVAGGNTYTGESIEPEITIKTAVKYWQKALIMMLHIFKHSTNEGKAFCRCARRIQRIPTTAEISWVRHLKRKKECYGRY